MHLYNVWFLAAGRRAATRLKRRRTWPGQLRVRSPDRCHRRPVTRANAAHQTQPLTQPQPSRDQALGGRGVLRPSRHPPPRPAPSAPPRPSCKAKKEKKKIPETSWASEACFEASPAPPSAPARPRPKAPSCKAAKPKKKEERSQRRPPRDGRARVRAPCQPVCAATHRAGQEQAQARAAALRCAPAAAAASHWRRGAAAPAQRGQPPAFEAAGGAAPGTDGDARLPCKRALRKAACPLLCGARQRQQRARRRRRRCPRRRRLRRPPPRGLRPWLRLRPRCRPRRNRWQARAPGSLDTR